MEKDHSQQGFTSILVAHRKTRSDFLNQINKLLDWTLLATKIKQYYHKGKSVDGRQSYSGLVLFKMLLLQHWYGLSDYEVEAQCNDSISFSHFIGIPLEDMIPDHSVISRFRTALTHTKAFDPLLEEINNQLSGHGLLVKTGSIVDASITDSPRRPRGKKEYNIVTDRKENQKEIAQNPSHSDSDTAIKTSVSSTSKLVPKTQKGVDQEAAWVRKANRLRYGYKKHIATDENGMVQAVCTTAANESDTKNLTPVLDKIEHDTRAWVKADKGYRSKENVNALQSRKLKSHIMHKATRGKPLSDRQAQSNKLISKIRYKVERTFGGMKRWFGAGTARYVGKERTHSQHVLESMAYNLYRSPNLYFLTQVKKTKGIPMSDTKMIA